MDKTPQYNTLRPYSMTVSKISEMTIAVQKGETEASLDVKMPIEQAKLLHELLGKKLSGKPHGFINFNISGLLK